MSVAFELGGLLYMPAYQKNIVEKIKENKIPDLRSVAFCLEDSIQDASLYDAEKALHWILLELKQIKGEGGSLPHVFVRIRTPEHMTRILGEFRDVRNVIDGFVLPKFDLGNADRYVSVVEAMDDKKYVMPILESSMVADAGYRIEKMQLLKQKLEKIKPYVLNVRVGGNDFCNLFGLRRKVDQDIYQIGMVRDVLVDILNVFGQEYVVSGPVWEYFGKDPDGKWAKGLKKECEKDILNGFVGKTAIHPSQLPIINEALKVSREDFEDAKQILGWNDEKAGCKKSIRANRMNEVKCHQKWAAKILILGQTYGVKEEEEE